MNNHNHPRLNWPAIFCWLVCPCTVSALLAALLFCTCSCTTTREIHHHHYAQADTFAAQSQADTHASNSTALLDSLMTALFTSQSASWSSHEDNTETITETITIAIDSLGRELRTEQRTTTRSASREQQQQWEQYRQEWEQHTQRQLQQYDSLYRVFESRLQTHYESATANDEQTVKNAQSPSWWQRLEAKVGGIAIFALLLAVGLFFTRQWWRNLLKH